MQIDTRSSPLFKVRETNDTTASITFPVPRLTEPSGEGIINMGQGGGDSSNGLMLIPFGAGSATNTFSMNCYAWTPTLGVTDHATLVPLWVATVLGTFTCTLSTVPGLATSYVNASQLFCGTIVLVVGTQNVSNEVISPTGNTVAHILLDTKGSKLVEIRFGTGASATSCNCLARRM